MANKTIPELNEEPWPQSTDFLLVHGSGLTKKVKLHNIQPDFYSSETIYLNYDPSTRHFIAHLKENSVYSYHIFPLSAANIAGSDKNIEEWLLEIYSNTQQLTGVSALQDTTFQFLLSNSPSWNTAFNIATAYSSISSTFAGATPQTLFFTESSAELSIANANVVSLSTFNVFSNTIKPLTANWQNTYTVVRTNSANWQNTYANVFNNSPNWQGAYTTVRTNSAKWEAAYGSTGGDLAVRALTGNWQDTYTTVQSNSSKWEEAYDIATVYSAASSTFLTTETDSQTLIFNETTKDLSISNGNTVSLSALIDLASVDTEIRTLTGNWQDTYTTVQSNSSKWEAAYGGAGSDLAVRALTGNWESTYTTVQGQSAQWASNVDTEVRALTGNWQDVFTNVQANSAQWAIDNSTDTEVRTLTGNWQDTYTTVQGQSAQWASNVDTGVRALTGNWQDTYTTVQANSSKWEAVYTNVSTNSATYVSTVITATPGISAVSTIIAVSALPVSPDPNTLYIVI